MSELHAEKCVFDQCMVAIGCREQHLKFQPTPLDCGDYMDPSHQLFDAVAMQYAGYGWTGLFGGWTYMGLHLQAHSSGLRPSARGLDGRKRKDPLLRPQSSLRAFIYKSFASTNFFYLMFMMEVKLLLNDTSTPDIALVPGEATEKHPTPVPDCRTAEPCSASTCSAHEEEFRQTLHYQKLLHDVSSQSLIEVVSS
jgi:hypothetical protein